MFTVRLAASENAIPGNARIELKFADGRFEKLLLPKPGTTVRLPPFKTPPEKFKLDIVYWLDQTHVGVTLGAVRDKDILTIYASPYQVPDWQRPGALFVGTVFHGDRQKEPCDVKCEGGSTTQEECCVICTKDNVIVETCC